MQPNLTRLSDFVLAYAREDPHADACIFGADKVSYRKLASGMDLVARGLIRVGVHRGDRVMLVALPGPEFIVTYLACARIGAIFVGVDPRRRIDDIEQIVHDAKPQVLIGMGELDGNDLGELLGTIMFACPETEEFIILGGKPHRFATSFDAFLEEASRMSRERVDQVSDQARPDDVLTLIYVPGRTGAMKGVMLTNRNFAETYRRTAAVYRADPVRLINAYPLDTIQCLGGAVAHAVISGGCQVFLDRFDPAACLAAIEREKVTVLGLEVAMYQRLVHDPAYETTDLSSLQQVWWTGGRAPADLVRKLEALPAICSTRWGVPETCGPVALTDPQDDNVRLTEQGGRPTRGFDIRAVDAQGEAVTPETPGEIQVRGECVMVGYFHRGEETGDLIDARGWYSTGFVGTIDMNESLRIIGQLDDIYVGGGYAIHPGEIEQLLERHPAVMRAAVFGVADAEHRQVGVAYVQPRPGAELTAAEIEEFASARLAPHAQLQAFWVRDRLPEDLIGNIDRRALRAEARRAYAKRMPTNPRFRELDKI